MKIREATEGDIPGILKVLKASLGEVSSKKTEKVWRYKHIDNPFGKSLVLIAVENETIIGVRAFMRWKWQRGKHFYSAFRAVDTATHPDYQGRGVFKKLTLGALEIGKQNGDHFVFNTPNQNSKPGYLKMGWVEVDKVCIELSLVNPISLFNKFNGNYYISKCSSEADLSRNLEEWRGDKIKRDFFFTPKDRLYLKWRYEENPLQKYFVVENKHFYIAAYIKDRGRIKEFRVSEKLIFNPAKKRELTKLISKMAKDNGAHFITSHPSKESKSLISINSNLGPVLTLKDINLTQDEFKELNLLTNWGYSLGDLELF